MQPPVGVHLELTCDQVTQLVREVLNFTLSCCKTTESQNILRKAILIFNAHDDAQWISETFNTSSTQTLSSTADNSNCISIKEEIFVQENESPIHEFESIVRVEEHPSVQPKRECESVQDSSASTDIPNNTFSQAEDRFLFDNYTVWRTDNRDQRCGWDKWESSNNVHVHTNESTEDSNSIEAFVVSSSSLDCQDIVAQTNTALSENVEVVDATLVQQEEKPEHSLCLEKQDTKEMALIQTLPVQITNPATNISDKKSSCRKGEILEEEEGKLIEQLNAYSTIEEEGTSKSVELARSLNSSSVKKKEESALNFKVRKRKAEELFVLPSFTNKEFQTPVEHSSVVPYFGVRQSLYIMENFSGSTSPLVTFPESQVPPERSDTEPILEKNDSTSYIHIMEEQLKSKEKVIKQLAKEIDQLKSTVCSPYKVLDGHRKKWLDVMYNAVSGSQQDMEVSPSIDILNTSNNCACTSGLNHQDRQVELHPGSGVWVSAQKKSLAILKANGKPSKLVSLCLKMLHSNEELAKYSLQGQRQNSTFPGNEAEAIKAFVLAICKNSSEKPALTNCKFNRLFNRAFGIAREELLPEVVKEEKRRKIQQYMKMKREAEKRKRADSQNSS